MLTYQKNSIKSLLLKIEAVLLDSEFNGIQDITNKAYMDRVKPIISIIDRNIQSIRKQINRL